MATYQKDTVCSLRRKNMGSSEKRRDTNVSGEDPLPPVGALLASIPAITVFDGPLTLASHLTFPYLERIHHETIPIWDGCRKSTVSSQGRLQTCRRRIFGLECHGRS